MSWYFTSGFSRTDSVRLCGTAAGKGAGDEDASDIARADRSTRRPTSVARGRPAPAARAGAPAHSRAAVCGRAVGVFWNAQRSRHVLESPVARRARPAVRALRLEQLDSSATPPGDAGAANGMADALQLPVGTQSRRGAQGRPHQR